MKRSLNIKKILHASTACPLQLRLSTNPRDYVRNDPETLATTERVIGHFSFTIKRHFHFLGNCNIPRGNNPAAIGVFETATAKLLSVRVKELHACAYIVVVGMIMTKVNLKENL